jgi:conjugal transfer pilus assembly protein TraV
MSLYPMFLKVAITVGLIGLLTGCASLNSHFDCPMKPGVMCKRLDQVDSMVDAGAITGTPYGMARGQMVAIRGGAAMPILLPVNAPIRYPERVMRLWVAPFEDVDGNYYSAHVIYTVVKPGHWRGFPPKAVEGEDVA